MAIFCNSCFWKYFLNITIYRSVLFLRHIFWKLSVNSLEKRLACDIYNCDAGCCWLLISLNTGEEDFWHCFPSEKLWRMFCLGFHYQYNSKWDIRILHGSHFFLARLHRTAVPPLCQTELKNGLECAILLSCDFPDCNSKENSRKICSGIRQSVQHAGPQSIVCPSVI